MTAEAISFNNVQQGSARRVALKLRGLAQGERRKQLRPRFWFGFGVVTLIAVVAVFAPVIAPYDPTAFHPADRFAPPSDTYLFGTDLFGRDLFSRVLHGAQITFGIALGAGAISAVSGILLGATVGLIGGWLDRIVTQIMDAWLALPYILVAVVLVVTFGRGDLVLMVALGLGGIASIYRLSRVEAKRTVARDYLEAAQALGASRWWLIVRYILPDLLPTMTVIVALSLGRLLIAVSSLSFIGLGPPPPSPEWGALLNDGRQYLQSAWWLTFYPGLVIGLTVYAINLIGDGLRDWLDPRVQ